MDQKQLTTIKNRSAPSDVRMLLDEVDRLRGWLLCIATTKDLHSAWDYANRALDGEFLPVMDDEDEDEFYFPSPVLDNLIDASRLPSGRGITWNMPVLGKIVEDER